MKIILHLEKFTGKNYGGFNMSTSVNGIGVRTTYPSSNVGTTNWVVLIASLPYTSREMTIFDSSGQTLEIGTCSASDPANSELRQFLLPPGGISVPIQIAQGMRVSIRAISALANSGENDTNVIF
jgi:hypothetical protein